MPHRKTRWEAAHWDCQLRHGDPVRTEMFQFNESDSNMLHRRWEEAGWHYYYEHQANGHQLRLADDSTYAKPIDGTGQFPFRHHGGAIEEDGIAQWSTVRQFQASSTRLSSYDFKAAQPQQVDVPTLNKQGAVLPVEHYEYTGAYGFHQHPRLDQSQGQERHPSERWRQRTGDRRGHHRLHAGCAPHPCRRPPDLGPTGQARRVPRCATLPCPRQWRSAVR